MNVVTVPVPAPAPGYFYNGIPTPRVWCHGRTELTAFPGTGMNVVQNIHKFRVRIEYPGYGSVRTLTEHKSFTHISSGYGYGSIQNSQKFRVRVGKYFRINTCSGYVGIRMLYPYPYPHSCTFVLAYPYPGYRPTGVQNVQKLRVRTHGYECLTELAEVSVRVISGEIPRVWLCTYPTRYNLETRVDNANER